MNFELGKEYILKVSEEDIKDECQMTIEEVIARIKNHKILHKMNEPRAIYISKALDMALEALDQINEIKKIIAIDNMVIQEDVIKYKMICEILKDKGR